MEGQNRRDGASAQDLKKTHVGTNEIENGLYRQKPKTRISHRMVHRDWLLFWLSGLIVAGVCAGAGVLSRSSRLQRRRRKSHTPIKAKTNRPMVRFSVRPPKK